MTFSHNLDFLRSLAVLLVMVDHTALALNHERWHGILMGEFGVAGVFMFFVHTALVLMWSLERKPYTLDFYVRRVFRVFPLAIAATLLVLATGAPLAMGSVPYFTPLAFTWQNLITNLFLVFNLFPGCHALLHVEWTLPWELQMYLLLPVLFAFARRDRSLWALLAFWALAVRLDQIYTTQVLSFPGSIPNFLAGVMAFVAYKRYSAKLPAWTFPVFLAALVLFFVFRPSSGHGWEMTLVLGLSLPLFHSFREGRFTRCCNLLARYSYGIYLLHPFGIWFGIGLLASHSRLLQLAVEVISTATLSVLRYHALEKPLIQLGSRVAAKLEVRDGWWGTPEAL